MSEFNLDYALMYDAIHSQKNYQREIQSISSLIPKSVTEITKILDFGCGTGNHAFFLQQLGYEVTGFDISKTMLDAAEEKFPQIKFVSTLDNLSHKFDYCLSLFDVLSYLSIEQLTDALVTINQVTNPGGKMFGETWHTPGVLHSPPTNKQRIFQFQGKELTRVVQVIDSNPPDFNLLLTIIDSENTVKYRETHSMRSYTEDELKECLHNAGFSPECFRPGAFGSPIFTENAFRIHFVAKKVRSL